MFAQRLGVIITFVLMTSPAFACYSGLTVIPTADMISKGQYSTELQMDSTISDASSDTRFINIQIGISDRWEAGVDFDVSNDSKTKMIFNMKYLLRTQHNDLLSLAAGISNMESSSKSSPFLVATKELRPFRLHFGGLRSEGKNYLFAGWDKTLSNKLMLMYDYTNGSNNYSSLGVNYQFTDNYALMLGTQFPNSGGDELYTMHFVICGANHYL